MDAPGPADDTSEAARAAHVEVLRRMGPDGRLRAGLRYSAAMIRLSRAALRARHPGADEVTLRVLWIRENYGEELARGVARRLGVRPFPPAGPDSHGDGGPRTRPTGARPDAPDAGTD